MQRWEYMAVIVGQYLSGPTPNQLGEQGWELVSAVDAGVGAYKLFFKRPLPPSSDEGGEDV